MKTNHSAEPNSCRHTPEPWYAYQREHPVGYTFGICNSQPCGTTVDEDGSIYTDFPDWNPQTSEIIALTYDSERAHANAARIVACVNACKGINPEAVPDLLAALKSCLPDLAHYASNHGPGPDKRLDAARAAIAKAEGGAS